MNTLALIGGTGLLSWDASDQQHRPETPYGDPSAAIEEFKLRHLRLLFLPRHGSPHRIPPHQVNYRANLWALDKLGAKRVLAVNAVGGISAGMAPGALALPDQLIDYTWGRAHSFSDADEDTLQHVEFARPYQGQVREALLQAAAAAAIPVQPQGTYGATQGPRLETAAEIGRMQRDGCDLVGMTGMPEAALARELGLDYASLCVVSNWAAGISEEPISTESIDATLEEAMQQARDLVRQAAIILADTE